MTQRLIERSGTRVTVPEGNGGQVRIRIMGWEPGAEYADGSSGAYPVEAIKRDFAATFPVGTRMRANHDGICDAGGDIRRVMAKTTSLPEFEEDGAYAWARVREGDATDFVRQFADVIGVSVSVAVELEPNDDDDKDDDDYDRDPYKRTEDGKVIVKRFLSMEESPYNSIDFVEAPGADGRIVQIAVESARDILEHTTLREAATFTVDTAKPARMSSEATPPRKHEKKENSMDKETQAIVEAAVNQAVTATVEALRPSTPASDDQPTFGQQAEAVIAAGLSEKGREAVYERIERGEALEAAISAETAREADIEAEVQRRVKEASTSPASESLDFGYTVDEGKSGPLADRQVQDEKVVETFEALLEEV